MRARAAAAAAAAVDLATIRTPRVQPFTRPRAAGDVMACMLDKYTGVRAADLGEEEIRALARKHADTARRLMARNAGGGAWLTWQQLCELVAECGGKITPSKKLPGLEDWARRACDAFWWRRQLRRWATRSYESGAYDLGLIGARAGQWYCSNRAVVRRVQQVKASVAMMKNTIIENDSGQQLNLWEVAQRSVSNKAIRRGELMTRVRGCEEWALHSGLQGIFTTNTCPSRYHSQLKGGGKNPKWDGSLPDAGQAWLLETWQKLRNKWSRDKVKVMGFRVAEPHHDGCPHWHMLLWCEPQHVEYVCESMRAQWLKDCGDEPGADKHRCKTMLMEAGGATGYIAKYIAKNIDDVHVPGGHVDDEVPQQELGADLLGDLEIKPSMRVETWATAWRIRQFQPIGQPSVTVWRELRRMSEEQAGAGSDTVIHAWLAAHRRGEQLACWRKYMKAQGGPLQARDDYRLGMFYIERQCQGRYGKAARKVACGVSDRRVQGEMHATLSTRRAWGGEGFASRNAAPPWTRFNNCTAHNRRSVGAVVNQLAEVRARHGLGRDFSETGAAGWPPD
ncbi:replication endonuclease [Comamonas sp. GB3 AK4-5]|uniref:replication endonuclease n=1 Tax=Comamonas sp. GB3 AK4-5 TaxID=3231487 RepID=UPI00351DFFB6